MPKKTLISLTLLLLTLSYNCTQKNRDSEDMTSTSVSSETDSEYEEFNEDLVEYAEIPDSEIAEMIDYYAGHPNDPRLPQNALGATDETLESTDPREISDLIDEGIAFATNNVEKEPRFLFAIGRAAYFLGYNKKAISWLEKAANHGSAPANAYLGYIAYYDENIDKAKRLLQNAISNGFDDEEAIEIYGYCNFQPSQLPFNEPKVITALYTKNWDYLKSDPTNKIYLATIHKTLWSNDILWLVDDPNILMKLDPEVNKSIENISTSFIEKIFPSGVNAMLSPAAQDAKRLAILYNTNPIAFQTIYNGISEYFKMKNY